MKHRTHAMPRVLALVLALTLLMPGLRVAAQDDGNVLRIHQIVYPDVVDPQKSSFANELAVLLGVRPFPLADDLRALYHAGAVIASNYLVTLRGMAGELLAEAAVPPEALDPLMRRVIDNDFQLTGPIERGDWETVERHRAAVAETAPHLLAAYDELARLTARDTASLGCRA